MRDMEGDEKQEQNASTRDRRDKEESQMKESSEKEKKRHPESPTEVPRNLDSKQRERPPKGGTLHRLSNTATPPTTVTKSPNSKMRSHPPISLNPARMNCSHSKRTTNHKIPTMTTSSTPIPHTSGSRLQTCSQGPSFLKINPEPSRNPFCQARDFGGLHVEISYQQARLSPSNNTKLTQEQHQITAQSKQAAQHQHQHPDNRTRHPSA